MVQLLTMESSIPINQFQYIKIKANTTDLSTKLCGISSRNSAVVPRSLALRSIEFELYQNWSIASFVLSL